MPLIFMAVRPTRLLHKFAARLTTDAALQQRFIDSIVKPSRYPQALIWTKDRVKGKVFDREIPLSWQPEFVDRIPFGQKPGNHDLHKSGHYYCLDFSSIFTVALSNVIPQASFIIDICSAPGGKGIYLWGKFRPERIILNEVIKKRTGMLISNVRRCGITNVDVTCQDSFDLQERYPKQADLVLVDAPCSGQSLRAKGQDAFGCFDQRIINGNAKRQKRIIDNSSRMVKIGGFLLYNTCTFSIEENEGVVEWFLKQNRDFQALAYQAYEEFQSEYTRTPCYRLWPYNKLGAGGFSALFQRIEVDNLSSMA